MKFSRTTHRISRMTRGVSIAAGVAIAALALSACAGDTPTTASTTSGESSASAEMVPITIGAVFTTAAVPLWVAEEQGFFEKYGLDVTITQSPNFAASAPSLLNGQMQFANAATAPVITAVEQGMPLQIVAGVQAEGSDEKLGDDQVMVPKDSTITRPRDLEGKTIATNAVGSGPYVGVMANYLADGGAPDGINWVVMNLNEQLPALESGQLDAMMASEPFVSQAKDAGFLPAFNAYVNDDLNVIPAGFTDAVLVASVEYLAKNPEIGEKMRNAMIDANTFAQENPEAVRTLLVERLELDPTVVEKSNLPAFVGEVTPEDIQAMIDAMFDVKLIAKELDAGDIVWLP